MKCPKCAYVGFEAADRCRHCGYEFSLIEPPAATPPPVPRSGEPARGPISRTPTPVPALDADLGHDDGAPLADLPLGAPVQAPPALPPSLFTDAQPPPARTPLAVRRTAERPRSRATPHVARRSSPALFEPAGNPARASESTTAGEAVAMAAPSVARLVSALIDVALLASIDAAVVYLTAQIAELPVAEAATLPLVPLCTFVFGLNVAYLTAFTANGGQTLGKMAMGLRVEATEGSLTFGSATVRVAAAIVGGLVMGAGFIPALFRADRRAVHDQIAHTRVVKVAA